MRDQINSFTPPLVWNEGSNTIPSQRLADAVEMPNSEVRRTLMITDPGAIDVKRRLQAAPLISKAGMMMDYFDASHSLSVILRESALSVPRQRPERTDNPRL
jgi:hypothetical protein